MNREEAGRGGGGRVGSGILENQQLAVCLLGEEELQEKGWGGGPLPGCSGLQSMDARCQNALAQASRASPFLEWKRKGSRPQESGNAVSGKEDLCADCWLSEEEALEVCTPEAQGKKGLGGETGRSQGRLEVGGLDSWV